MKTMKAIIHRRYVVTLVAVITLSSLCLALPRQSKGKKPATGRDKWQQPERVVADLGLRNGATIADIGCGSGYFTFRLSRAVGEKGKVFATEISARGLKSVADRAKRGGIKNIETVLSEPTKTKLEPESIDAALISMVLHHVKKEHRVPLVKDIAKAIKPDGSLYILEWRVNANVKYDKHCRIPRDELVGWAEGAGLKLDAEFFYLEHQVLLRFNKPMKK